MDQIDDRADLERMLPCKLHEVRQPRHRAVIVHDLAQHRSRRMPRQPREIAARFGVTGARQHAALLRHEGKDMTGMNNILRLGVRRACHADRMRAVRRRNAGGHALRSFDRDGEVGPMHRSIHRCHRREIERSCACLRDRHANQTPAVLGHKVDHVGSDAIRGHDQIAFVLAVLFVDEHGHAPRF